MNAHIIVIVLTIYILLKLIKILKPVINLLLLSMKELSIKERCLFVICVTPTLIITAAFNYVLIKAYYFSNVITLFLIELLRIELLKQ